MRQSSVPVAHSAVLLAFQDDTVYGLLVSHPESTAFVFYNETRCASEGSPCISWALQFLVSVSRLHEQQFFRTLLLLTLAFPVGETPNAIVRQQLEVSARFSSLFSTAEPHMIT